MYCKPILSSVALFFLAATSANAAPRKSEGPHQILARSHHLSLRQANGDSGPCTSICDPLLDKADACGTSDSCACAPSMSEPFFACGRCGYKHATTASEKAKLEKLWDDYVDGCTAAGYPIVGNTSINGSVQSDTSPSSTPATAAAASTTASTSASSTQTSSNGAIGLSSGFDSSVAIPIGALAMSALLF